MLEIKNLHVKLAEEDKVILRGLDLTIGARQTLAGAQGYAAGELQQQIHATGGAAMPPQAGAFIGGEGQMQHRARRRERSLIAQALHQLDGGCVRHLGDRVCGAGCTLAGAGVPLCDHRYQSGTAATGSMRP